MKYTKDVPTEPGFYWVKVETGPAEAFIEQVVEIMANPYAYGKSRGSLCVFAPGWECPEDPAVYGLEWAGPIPKPEES